MRKSILAGMCAAIVASAGGALPANANQRAVTPTQWNNSSDPAALYGYCDTQGSGLGGRVQPIKRVGGTLTNVLAVTVLECKPATGGGGNVKVPCPSGTPYAFCIRNDNDGIGNYFRFGVLKVDGKTNPYGNYRGCPAGVATKPRMNLLLKAGKDPRLVSGIVTLECAAGGGPVGVSVVDCPVGPNPYAYCLGTGNDGNGTAVKVGVVAANGPGDPYGLYGECGTAAEGVSAGFQRKSSIVQSVVGSLANVGAIYLPTCTNAAGNPAPAQVVPCTTPGFIDEPVKFDKCIQGRDSLGNFVRAGILLRN